MKAHFFDLDVLIEVDNKVWIVDKNIPNIPIIKISMSDFKMIKNGVFKSQRNKVEYNGTTYWMPDYLFNKLKVKLKNRNIGLGNIGISMQEFLNKELIDNINFNIDMSVIGHLKNTNDDIFIVCSKQTKNNYVSIVENLEKKLNEEGLKIKKFYFISDTLLNQNEDDIKFKKQRLLLQNLIGYKNDRYKFIDEEVDRYDNLYFYDNEYDTIKISDEINLIFQSLLNKTDDGLKSVIKEDISEYRPVLYVNQVTDNHYNKKITKKVDIDYNSLIKTFESFKKFH